jgi:Family of unknown function (DUF6088)
MSTSVKVSERIARLRKGVPFSIEGFYQLGSRVSVQKAMSRMAKEGEIVRVTKGMYVRPKPLPSVPSIKMTASPEQVAKAWAKERGFKLASQGLEAAYKLGFQTQAPVKTVLWSNGPTREFKVGNATVSVRHVSPKKLLWLGRPEGMLLRSIAVTNPETIGIGAIKTALKRLSLSETEAKAVVKNLQSAALPSGWQEKLKQIEQVSLY